MKTPISKALFLKSVEIRSAAAFSGLIFCTIAILYYSLDLRTYDLSVPFNYSGDSIIIALHIKGIIEDGWPYAISNLSAPFTYPAASFPLLTSTDWALMKIASIFTDEIGLILNTFWLLSFLLTSATSFITFKIVGLKNASSAMGALVFSLLPYAFLRNVSHLNLDYYLLPICCLSIFLITSTTSHLIDSKKARNISLLGLTLLGFNYIYYSFFCALLLIFSITYAFFFKGAKKQIKFGIISLAILATSTTINLSQYYYSLSKNGAPVQMSYKRIAESEVFGAKLRTMILPHPDNKLPPFRHLAEKSLKANFPLENENTTARLGLLASIGFFISLGAILLKESSHPSLPSGGQGINSIILVIFMLMTIGGIGSIINLITIPDFRAYNRLSVFIAFFSIYVFFSYSEKLLATTSKLQSNTIKVAIFFIFILSIYDQCLDKKSVVRDRHSDLSQALSDKLQVKYLESILPTGSGVLQLPLTGYPPLEKHHNMWSYDHGRPALWGNHLRWSWPSFSKEHRKWQNNLSKLKGRDFANEITASGFQAVWIDLRGFSDNGLSIITLLKESGWSSTKKMSNSVEVLIKPINQITQNSTIVE